MPNDNAGGWPDPTRMGVPMLPEVDAFHWLLKRNGAWPEAWLWHSDADGCGTEHSGAWAESDGDGQPDTMARWYSYLGPCLTPAEVTAREQAAAVAMREAAAEAVRFHIQETDPSPALACDLMDAIRALPIPADASAALAEVVRRAKEEEREAIASDIDCGCDVKPVVLTKLASHGEREAWRCCGQHYDACLAVQAAAIRARSTEGTP